MDHLFLEIPKHGAPLSEVTSSGDDRQLKAHDDDRQLKAHDDDRQLKAHEDDSQLVHIIYNSFFSIDHLDTIYQKKVYRYSKYR